MSEEELSEEEKMQLVLAVLESRKEAFKQAIWGLLWWGGSAIAMYAALGSTSDGILWFGGALGALFHWYRAGKVFKATYEAGLNRIVPKEKIVVAFTALLIVTSSLVIFPEWIRTTNPQIGTCWGDVGGGSMTPIACWSGAASAKTVGYSNTQANCSMESDSYFDPSSWESRVTCLKTL
jgi:hypothetical protein